VRDDPFAEVEALHAVGDKDHTYILDMQLVPTVDATGLVVAPGFIDLHSHGQTPENYRYKAMDGVTTALELEVGVWPVPPWYASRQGKALINFGASSGHIPARMAVMHDSGTLLPRDAAVNRAATPAEREEIYSRVRQGLNDGALGIGLGIAYVPKSTREEILDLFRLAAERKVVIYVHMRNGGPVEPGVIDALQEVIADAAATGDTATPANGDGVAISKLLVANLLHQAPPATETFIYEGNPPTTSFGNGTIHGPLTGNAGCVYN